MSTRLMISTWMAISLCLTTTVAACHTECRVVYGGGKPSYSCSLHCGFKKDEIPTWSGQTLEQQEEWLVQAFEQGIAHKESVLTNTSFWTSSLDKLLPLSIFACCATLLAYLTHRHRRVSLSSQDSQSENV